MADEIFINTGGTFQQPYQGQVPANAQESNDRQTTYTVPANAQSPFTYNNRTPTTYRNPVSSQEPNIRNTQQPFTYNRQGQTPSDYQHQSPFTYRNSVSSQTPFTYNHRSPFTYSHRSPSVYQHRTPSTYNFRSPSVYRSPVNAQEPNIRNAQTPYPYIATGQEPNIRAAQQPYIYQATGQEPNIRSAQQPYPYIAAAQEPNIRTAQSPFTYQYRSPSTYNFRSPSEYQHQSPFTFNARSPSTYSHRSPSTYAVQSPYIANATGTQPASGRVPYIYAGDTTSETLLRSFWIHDTANSGPSAADAQIRLKIKYSGNNIQIWGYYGGNPDEDATNHPNTGNPQVYALCYTVEPDYENATGYTVKYTVANGDGQMTVTGGMSLNTAYSIPTDDSRIIQFSVDSEIGFGSYNASRETCNITIHLEKTGYTTWTYTPTLDIRAISTHAL